MPLFRQSMISLRSFSLLQIELIATLPRAKGIRDLARTLDLDAAVVSRRLKDVEDTLRVQLFVRSKKGILLTPRGQEISTICQNILIQSKQLSESPKSSTWSKKTLVTCGSRAFMNIPFAESVTRIDSDKFRWRFVDSSPQDLLRASLVGSVDAALHLEDWSWPSSWQTEKLANMTWALVTKYNHPLKQNSKLNDIKQFPFIVASYLNQDRVERATDLFKLKWSERILGHEAQTTSVMKSILLSTQHLAFLPLISVSEEIRKKDLKIISVQELPLVNMPISLSVHQERLSQAALQLLRKAVIELDTLNSFLLSEYKPSSGKPESPIELNNIKLSL